MAIKKKNIKDLNWNSIVGNIPTATRTAPGMMAPIEKRFMPQTLMGGNTTGLFIFGTVPRGTQLGFILFSLGRIENPEHYGGSYIVRVHQDDNNNTVKAKLITLDGTEGIKVFLKDGNILAVTRTGLWTTINFVSTIPFVERISTQNGTDGFEEIAG